MWQCCKSAPDTVELQSHRLAGLLLYFRWLTLANSPPTKKGHNLWPCSGVCVPQNECTECWQLNSILLYIIYSLCFQVLRTGSVHTYVNGMNASRTITMWAHVPCRFFRPATPQPKRKRLRLMYQSDKARAAWNPGGWIKTRLTRCFKLIVRLDASIIW